MSELNMHALSQYDVKILLALLKSIEGRKDFFRWLIDNGYRELAAFSNSIRGDEVALYCLVQQKMNWLAILSNATGGDEKALAWVKMNLPETEFHFARACMNDIDSAAWLKRRHLELYLLLAHAVSVVNETQACEKAGPYVMHF